MLDSLLSAQMKGRRLPEGTPGHADYETTRSATTAAANKKASLTTGLLLIALPQPLLGKANCAASWLARCGQRWVIDLRRV